jgi:hypothetical protein
MRSTRAEHSTGDVREQMDVVAIGERGEAPIIHRVPLNAVNGPVLVHYLVVLTGLQTS